MKPYKLKRKMDEQKRLNPNKSLRHQKFASITRKIALENFRQLSAWRMRVEYGESFVDIFTALFHYEASKYYDNITMFEIERYFPLYNKYTKKLEAEQKKSDFMNKVYKPLEEDLFNI